MVADSRNDGVKADKIADTRVGTLYIETYPYGGRKAVVLHGPGGYIWEDRRPGAIDFAAGRRTEDQYFKEDFTSDCQKLLGQRQVAQGYR